MHEIDDIYLRKSKPAACSEPFVGSYAFSVNLAQRNVLPSADKALF